MDFNEYLERRGISSSEISRARHLTEALLDEADEQHRMLKVVRKYCIGFGLTDEEVIKQFC